MKDAFMQTRPKVLIVGGGFAGLEAAKSLAKAPVDVILIDRRNHHVFQPLLYQVATASLSPADISSPIRRVLRNVKNCRVVLAEVTGVDVAAKQLRLGRVRLPYDYLLLAAGASHSYFGRDEWATLAPGLKSIEDATEIRRRMLLSFESAEYEASPAARQAALTFAVIGAGPTGVELAGSIKEIAMKTIRKDFRSIDTRETRVILFEGLDRVLPPFPPELSARAQADLEKMGVEIRLKAMVTNITPQGLSIGEEFVPTRNVFWAAGVKASGLGKALGVETDRAGRVVVGPDLSVPGHPEIFVLGDMAAAKSADTGKPIPGVAQGALQGGAYAAKCVASEVAGRTTPAERQPFSYWDKGSMAVIGKNKAVAQVGNWKIGGFLAWLMWGAVHILFLVGFRNRAAVVFNWVLNYLVNARDARLITGDARLHIETYLPEAIVVPADAERLQTSHTQAGSL
jgi:NADH:ubiquinone reductase (H+-translocating)